MHKVDIFVLKNTPYDSEAFQRKRKNVLAEGHETEFYLATAEDIILNKFNWFRMGGQVSERQWLDVLGVLKVQKSSLDLTYLRKWSRELEVTDLLEQAFQEAGIG